MLGYHITSCEDGSTRCETSYNPPRVAWVAWPREAVPNEWAQRLADVDWQTLCCRTLRRWAWRRRPARFLGTLIDRARLDSAIEQLTDDLVDAASVEADGITAVVLRDLRVVVVLSPLADDGGTYPEFVDAIRAQELSPAFGPLVPLWWFDGGGCGPYDNVELLVHGWHAGEAWVSLELVGLAEHFGVAALGTGSISAREARRLAGLLNDAADWCDAQVSKGGASNEKTIDCNVLGLTPEGEADFGNRK